MNISMRFERGMPSVDGARQRKVRRAIASMVFLTPALAQAVDATAPLTPQEISVAVEQTRRDCQANQLFAVYHDCACVAAKVGEYRVSQGRTPTKEKLVGLAGEACPSDPRVIYAYYFETCAGSMKPMRTDWETMCGCSTGKVVEGYLANPNQNTRHIAGLQRDSLKACGFGDRSRSIAR